MRAIETSIYDDQHLFEFGKLILTDRALHFFSFLLHQKNPKIPLKKRNHRLVSFQFVVLSLYSGHSLYAEMDKQKSFKWAALGAYPIFSLGPQTFKGFPEVKPK
jgi:hypothetical protein